MLFVSKKKKFRIILKPSAHVLDAYGQKVMIPGITREFMNGRLYEEDPMVIGLLLKNPHRPSQYDVAVSKDEEQAWATQHPDFTRPTMTTGAIGTTVGQAAAVAATQGPLRDAAARREEAAVVDLDKMLDEKINAKISPLLEKLDKLLEVSAPAPVKPKKVFTCQVPGCGQVFDTGMKLGEHKRTAHIVVE